MTSNQTILEVFTFYAYKRLTLNVDAAELLDYLDQLDRIYETHVITGAAYGSVVLVKIYLRVSGNISDFVSAIHQDFSDRLTTTTPEI